MEQPRRAILYHALQYLYPEISESYDVTESQAKKIMAQRHGPFRSTRGMLCSIPDLALSAPQLALRINWVLRYITLHPSWPWPPPAPNTVRARVADKALHAAVSLAVRGMGMGGE